jgi:hypothetical protein
MNPFEFYGQDYIPGILTDSECLELKDHLHKKFDKLPCISDPGRGMVKMIYRPEEAETVQDRVRYFLERYLQAPLYPTYWFSTQYYNRSYMAAHTDREACEVSVSLNISQDAPWQLCLRSKTGRIERYQTPPGDAVLYAGTKVEHWRTPYHGQVYTQLFLHYVKKHGSSSKHRYDQTLDSNSS